MIADRRLLQGVAVGLVAASIGALYTVFARACDPVLGFLKAGGQHSDEQIVEWVLSTCLDGLVARA